MINIKTGIIVLGLSIALLAANHAQADSWAISYQAYLTDADGAPVEGSVPIQFDAYNVEVGGSPLWGQSQTVDVTQGLVTVTLGSPVNPFPPGLFDSSVYIAIAVNGEDLQPRRQLLSSAFSFKAANSELLGGLPAAQFDQAAEVESLQDSVDDQASRLSDLEGSPSDITAVVAGAGLTGGADSGSATISLAVGGVEAANMAFNAITGGAIQAGAVNSTKIENGTVAAIDMAANAIDSSKIVNGSIVSEDIGTFAVTGSNLAPFTITAFNLAGGSVTPEKVQDNSLASNKISDNSLRSIDIFDGTIESVDIASGGVAPQNLDDSAIYSVGGLNVQGATSVVGPLLLSAGSNSIGDIFIADNLSKMRFFNADQSEELASLVVGDTVTLTDEQRNRTMIHSKASGIGIGTTQLAGTAVTLDDTTVSGELFVEGNVNAGYQVVNKAFTELGFNAPCSNESGQCNLYVSEVVCPSGLKPIGGGFNFEASGGGFERGFFKRSSVSSTNPNAWRCGYEDKATGLTAGQCQAICLRVN